MTDIPEGNDEEFTFQELQTERDRQKTLRIAATVIALGSALSIAATVIGALFVAAVIVFGFTSDTENFGGIAALAGYTVASTALFLTFMQLVSLIGSYIRYQVRKD